MDKVKCCLVCVHCLDCPLIIQWVKVTESPIEGCEFSCSEYERE